MSLSNIKRMKNEQGFTIVELLIVIIVIGILAAIIIVAYNGITNNARDNAAQAAGATLQKKVEALNAQAGYYPGYSTGTATAGNATTDFNNATYPSANLSGTNLTLGVPDSTNYNTKVKYEICTAVFTSGSIPGYRISYYKTSTQAVTAMTNGTGGSGSIPATTIGGCTTWVTGT